MLLGPRTRPLLAALGLALSLATPIASAEGPAPAPAENGARARFAGTYTFSGGQKEKDAVLAAIERATEKMNFIARPIARKRLRESTVVRDRLDLALSPGRIKVTAGGSTYDASDDGKEIAGVGSDGEPVRVSQRFERDRMIQIIRTDKGLRRAEWVLSPSGDALSVRISIESSHLPAPVRYDLTYAKKN